MPKNILSSILKDCWDNYKSDLFPKDRRMRILEELRVEGMNSENIRFLINETVKRIGRNAIYLEIGTYRGCSLLSAALFNPHARCIGIDDFSEFRNFSIDKALKLKHGMDNRDNRDVLVENLEKFGMPKNIRFIHGDYKDVIEMFFKKKMRLKVDVFFFDGEHTYESHLEAMNTIKPFLAKDCLILIDDTNWSGPRKASRQFTKENPEFKSIFSVRTPGNFSKKWWNGFEVIARGYS